MVAHAFFCDPEEACGPAGRRRPGRCAWAYCLTNADHSARPTRWSRRSTSGRCATPRPAAGTWPGLPLPLPHPGLPLATDVARALEPDWLYVLVSLQDREAPAVRGFWIR